MNKIIIEDTILIDEESAKTILTDEIPAPKDGAQGPKGEKGESGAKGDAGKDGLSIKGERGERGPKGESITGPKGDRGENGSQGPAGYDGKNGKDGKNGDDGISGKDGNVWFLFKTQVDEKKGKDGDLALVESTSNYYRREQFGDFFIWKFKGNLKGKDGEKGERGYNGSSYTTSGSGEITAQHTFICVDIYDDGTLFLASNVTKLYESSLIGPNLELINLVESA